MANAKKRWFKCSRCNTKVYDTVITKHMWKSHRAHMMKNRGGRKAKSGMSPAAQQALSPAPKAKTKYKPKKGEAYSMLEAHRGEKVDGRSAWGRTVNYERKLEAERLAAKSEEPRLRATHLASEGKTLTITVHQGKNYVEISNVTLVEISE